ncbi:MAG: hypothetical protein V1735_03435 [Nanoarchaeota archaeon]
MRIGSSEFKAVFVRLHRVPDGADPFHCERGSTIEFLIPDKVLVPVQAIVCGARERNILFDFIAEGSRDCLIEDDFEPCLGTPADMLARG